MDPITHSLVGAAIAGTRPLRKLPLATITLVLAANVPDVDVLAYAAGGDAALAFRRGWTHGPLGLLLLPAILAWVLLAIGRTLHRRGRLTAPLRLRATLALCYLGAITHPALDWLNTYGIRLLMPFDARWFYGDSVYIVDPWIWLLLGGTLFLSGGDSPRWTRSWTVLAVIASVPMLLGAIPLAAKVIWLVAIVGLAVMTRSDVRRRLGTGPPLIVFAVYVVAMIAAGRVARVEVRAEAETLGIGPIEELMVGPVLAHPLRHDVVIATSEGYRYGRFGWLEEPRLELSSELLTPRAPFDDPTLAEASRDPCVEGFMAWARFPWAQREESADGGHTVFLLDARYTRVSTRSFGGTVVEVP